MEERMYPVGDFCDDKVPLEEDKSLVDRITKLVEGVETEKSKITVMGIGHTKSKHGYEGRQVYLSGGLNGTGDWVDYLKDMSEIARAIRDDFKGEVVNVVLANLEEDLLDDIFYPVIDIVWSYDKDDGEEEDEEKDEK